MKKMNKKGFTLIEMLVVIAIIAILVSIIIPVVSDSTEKARESADAANIRAAITTATTKGIATGTAGTETTVVEKVKITQTSTWDHVKEIGGKAPLPTWTKGTEATITYTIADGTIAFS